MPVGVRPGPLNVSAMMLLAVGVATMRVLLMQRLMLLMSFLLVVCLLFWVWVSLTALVIEVSLQRTGVIMDRLNEILLFAAMRPTAMFVAQLVVCLCFVVSVVLTRPPDT